MGFWKKSDETAAPSDVDRPPASPDPKSVASATGGQDFEKQIAASKALTTAFGEITALLMRSQEHRILTLADLDGLVVPALLTRQFSVATAQSKQTGSTLPVGVVLWASVSEDVDKRLRAAPEHPASLKPQEWKGGPILWVVLAAGNQSVVRAMLKQLETTEWAGRTVNASARGSDGKRTIVTLETKAA